MITLPTLTKRNVADFQQKGFFIVPSSILAAQKDGDRCIAGLESVLNGEGDLGTPPLCLNKLPRHYLGEGNRFRFKEGNPTATVPAKVTTIHAVNMWRTDSVFRDIVLSPSIGTAVTQLMGWEAYGCRLAQDQVWIKPPLSGPLSFHRDTPYIDFSPKEVCTVWIAFDDVSCEDIGTLEYCVGSHQWGDGKRGSANQFYHCDYKKFLTIAAQEHFKKEVSLEDLEIQPVIGVAGCCAFHNGRTWHGSGPNRSPHWRRGLGVHYVRGDAVLAENPGKLWTSLQDSDSFESIFPLVCSPLLS